LKSIGEEKGKEIFAARQNLWHKSFKKTNYSMISQDLFWKVYNKINDKYSVDDIFFAEFDKGVKSTSNLEYALKLESTSIKPDFLILSKKLIIEFDGDYWHSSERRDLEKDALREQEILNAGYKILHIKECDYRKDESIEISRCLEFLNEEAVERIVEPY